MKNGVWMFVIWFSTAGGSVWANQSAVWHQGELWLQNGVAMTGEINFNWVAQVVQYRQGNTVKAYSAYQIEKFTLIDEQMNAVRNFAAVTGTEKSGLHRPRILEQVIVGTLLVYRELRPLPGILKVSTLTGYSSDEAFSKDLKNFNYLVFSNEELVPLGEFYRKTWPRLKKTFQQEIKNYEALIRADMTGLIGQLRLIRMYNTLSENRYPQSAPRSLSVGY